MTIANRVCTPLGIIAFPRDDSKRPNTWSYLADRPKLAESSATSIESRRMITETGTYCSIQEQGTQEHWDFNMVCNVIYSITSKHLPPNQSKQTFAVTLEKHNNKKPKRLKTACWPKFRPYFILTANITIRTGISACVDQMHGAPQHLC